VSGERVDRVLVLVLDERPDLAALRRVLNGARETSVRLVAPRHVGPLRWYATDESDEQDAAEARARETGAAVAPGAERVATAGDPDPVLAVEDALSDFDADRIVVLGAADAALDESLRRLRVPVERAGGPAPEPGGALRETGRALMSGRSPATPYAVLGGAIAFLVVFGLVVLVMAALILWL
jgi:hypothetical protein